MSYSGRRDTASKLIKSVACLLNSRLNGTLRNGKRGKESKRKTEREGERKGRDIPICIKGVNAIRFRYEIIHISYHLLNSNYSLYDPSVNILSR